MKKTTYIFATTFMMLFAGSGLKAQLLDAGPGRGPNLEGEAQLSAEGHLTLGGTDFLGARVNFLLSETILLFGDIGTVDVGDALSFGGGAMMNLDLGLPVETAIRGTFHMASEDNVDVWTAKAQFMVGGDLEAVEGTSWFGHAGLGYLSQTIEIPGVVTAIGAVGGVEVEDSEVYFILGGGAVYEMQNLPLELIAGIDLLVADLYDDVVISLGARWSF